MWRGWRTRCRGDSLRKGFFTSGSAPRNVGGRTMLRANEEALQQLYETLRETAEGRSPLRGHIGDGASSFLNLSKTVPRWRTFPIKRVKKGLRGGSISMLNIHARSCGGPELSSELFRNSVMRRPLLQRGNKLRGKRDGGITGGSSRSISFALLARHRHRRRKSRGARINHRLPVFLSLTKTKKRISNSRSINFILVRELRGGGWEIIARFHGHIE